MLPHYGLTWLEDRNPNIGTVVLRNYLKTVIVTGGGTRAGRTPVESGPYSWTPFCHSEPESPGTWTARPRCVHHPAAGRIAFHPAGVQFLLPYASYARPVSPVSRRPTASGVVISLIRAQVLWGFPRTARAGHDDVLRCLPQQLGVVNVGSGNHHAQGASAPLNQNTPLAACLGPVRGVGAD